MAPCHTAGRRTVPPCAGSHGRADSATIDRLATLGDPPVRFDAWTELVWLEYRHLFAGEADPRRTFLERRSRVLGALQQATLGQSFLGAGFDAAFAANLERLAPRTPH